MLRSMLVDTRKVLLWVIIHNRSPLNFGNNTLRVSRLIPLFAQLVRFIAERSGGTILEEVTKASPEERRRLFDDSFVRHEHFP